VAAIFEAMGRQHNEAIATANAAVDAICGKLGIPFKVSTEEGVAPPARASSVDGGTGGSDSPGAPRRSPDVHYMYCVCSPEGKAEADELMAEVLGLLQVDVDTLLTAVVVSLNWDFHAAIESIGNDQWSGVDAATYDGDFRTYIECDRVEHGIAGTWKAFRDRFPTKWERSKPEVDDERTRTGPGDPGPADPHLADDRAGGDRQDPGDRAAAPEPSPPVGVDDAPQPL
jgi:hypothetical protein